MCRFIHRETGLRAVLIGCRVDDPDCLALAEKLGPDLPVENLAGKTDLAGLFELIASARLLVTNESGPLHVGHNCATPTLSIVSGADFKSYCSRPDSAISRIVHAQDMSCFDCRWNCVHPIADKDAPRKCLADVGVDQAIAAARALLAADTFTLNPPHPQA